MKLKNKESRSLWYKKIFFYLKSGQSLSESVRTAATDTDMMYIHEELLDGTRFSDVCAMPEMQGVFTNTEISLLKVAEQTGTMQSVCGVLSGMLKNQHQQSQKLIAALIYPILVLCMAVLLLLMILIVIVPKIGPLFSSMKSMPITTKILIALSNHVVGLWYVDISILAVSIAAVFYIKTKTQYFAYIQKYMQYICIRTPYLKEVYLYWFIERWIQVTHLSLQSKVSLVQSLGFAHEAVTNSYLQKQFTKVTDSVRAGNTCAEALGTIDLILKNKLKDWASVISSGEKTGTLQEVFEVSHEHIAENLKESFDRFQKVIEPLLIILVGVMVLCICLSIILPMYQLTQSIQ
ncbi:MAG: type II secretion system F family protein [Patescibacteria group bacterium]